jgi:hypothetical protein
MKVYYRFSGGSRLGESVGMIETGGAVLSMKRISALDPATTARVSDKHA